MELALGTVVLSGIALGSLQYVQALGTVVLSRRGRSCSGDCGPVWHGLGQTSVCAILGHNLPWNLLWGLWSRLAGADFSMCNTRAELTVERALGTVVRSGVALGRL